MENKRTRKSLPSDCSLGYLLQNIIWVILWQVYSSMSGSISKNSDSSTIFNFVSKNGSRRANFDASYSRRYLSNPSCIIRFRKGKLSKNRKVDIVSRNSLYSLRRNRSKFHFWYLFMHILWQISKRTWLSLIWIYTVMLK